MMKNEQSVIGIQYGDVDGDYKCEKIILTGIPYEEGSSFMSEVELMVHYMDDAKFKFKIDFSGYAINLFLGDFLQEGYDQILITGQSGGSVNYVLTRLYKFEQNCLKLVIDDEDLSNLLQYQTFYQNDGQIGVQSLATGAVLTLNVRGRRLTSPGYNHMSQPFSPPSVSTINTIYPIKQPYSNYYTLQLQQRILDEYNADILGMIQTVIELTQLVPVIQSQAIIQFS